MSNVEERARQLAVEDEADSDKIFKIIKRFLLRSVAWVGIYLLGFFDFSFAWLLTPLLLSVLRDQWKKERDDRLSAARQAALTSEKAMIESRIKVEDLPSWVFFPDKERAEWVNSIIQQLWANVGNYVRKVIAESVEPGVKTTLEGYGLYGFQFEKVVLGQIPPRITGIKVYDNRKTSRNEIVMDTDVIFASDSDIKFSLKGITAKISDLSVRGLVRIVFKPLVNDIPLIGGVQVYFLTNPDIHFDLGGIANALDTPGLSRIIRKIVLEQLGNFMVLPNKFTMALAESVGVRQLKCPDTAGVLRVRLKKGEKLAKKDVGMLGMGKSDPYAILSVGARQLKTQHIENSVNPEWNFVGDFPIEVVHGQQLTIEVWDHDDHSDDEFLGSATVATGLVVDRGQISDMWVVLEGVDTGRVLMSLSWLQVSDDDVDADDVSLLHVYVDSCQNLQQEKKVPSPLVELRVSTSQPQVTWPQQHTLDPVFEQGFVFLVYNSNSDDLHLKVINSAAASAKPKEMGTLKIPISQIMSQKNHEYVSQPFSFTDGSPGTITLSLQLKSLKRSAAKKNILDPNGRESPRHDNMSAADTGEQAGEITNVNNEAVSAKTSLMIRTDAGLSDTTKEKPKVTGSPSLDEVIGGTVDPIMKTAGIEHVKGEEEMVIRKRAAATSSASNCGKVRLTIRYIEGKEHLDVVVHQATGLPGADLPDPPDPYVKLYLLPERSRKSKRKSEAKKDTVDPIYEESFEYDNMSISDMKNQKLEVSVIDRKGIFAKGSLMGRTIIDLSGFISNGGTDWYVLEEDDSDSD